LFLKLLVEQFQQRVEVLLLAYCMLFCLLHNNLLTHCTMLHLLLHGAALTAQCSHGTVLDTVTVLSSSHDARHSARHSHSALTAQCSTEPGAIKLRF
jgi:hypothetical protein